MGRTFSVEDPGDGRPEPDVDCGRRTPFCKAVCCSFRFALTEEEADGGTIRFDEAHPCFIARGSDGYCTHHDRGNRSCTIWNQRPLRCRRYSCLDESEIWENGDSLAILPGTFDHLSDSKSDS
jgi:Fe-S-cluster containining protein